MDGPIPIFGIHFTEESCPSKVMCCLLKRRSFVDGTLMGTVHVLGVKADPQTPLRVSVKVRLDTLSICSVILAITPMFSILESSCLMASLRWIAYLRLGCTCGLTVRSGISQCGSLKSPIVTSNLLGNILLRSEMSEKLTFSGGFPEAASALMSSHWRRTMSSCFQLEIPKIAGPSDSAIKNCRSCQPDDLKLQGMDTDPCCLISPPL